MSDLREVPLKRLKPWAKNPRDNEEAVDEVVASIKRFGFGAPIVARKADGRIIAGHTRYAAAVKLGLEKVPVRFMDLTEVEADALALADNKLGEIATWDDTKLAEILADLKNQDFSLEGMGFDEAEVEKLLGGLVEDPDAAGSSPSPGTGNRTNFAPVIKYEIVFEDSAQQERWFRFLRLLKMKYGSDGTVAARVDAFLTEHLAAAGE